ncbi:MAG: hypothetical protein RLZZ511_645 [Cyanobacteriota bacterium]
MRMKRWESPRREGRNDKGKKKSARQRQIKKQTQVWRKKLKDGIQGNANKSDPNPSNQNHKKGNAPWSVPFFNIAIDYASNT